MTFSHDDKLNEIEKRVTSGERLSFEDGLALMPLTICRARKLADIVRRRRHGRTTYFNVNRHLNPTEYLLRRLQILRLLPHAATA
jgi:aminodeoxyfutalosine synthase